MPRSRAPRRPFWLIAKQENSRIDVLDLDPCEEVLTVFSYEEEAEMFLWLGTPETRGWRAKGTTTGELISLLRGPCVGVKKVALDPLPAIGGKTIIGLMSLEREDFVQNLIGEQGRRETQGEERMQGEAAGRHEEIRDEAPNGTDDAGIPDYAMRDFGPPEGVARRSRRPASSQDSGHGLTEYGEGRE